MIRLEQVSVRRGAALVLRDISTDIPAGAITAVVGPSGVGKTTLLGTLNGLIRPLAGRVAIAGEGLPDGGDALRAYRRRTATVFQEHALIGRLTALDNVLLGLADRRSPLSILPWPRSLCLAAAAALDEVGLLHRANVRTAWLSGGERQRVGLARALVRNPRLLLGDEPFASVDPGLVRQLGGLLRRRVDQDGMTVVLVIHQLDTALSLADKVIALSEGRIVFDGPPGSFDAFRQQQVFRPLGAEPAGRREESPRVIRFPRSKGVLRCSA
jgi:phosphonate transport system ATP-binding protein